MKSRIILLFSFIFLVSSCDIDRIPETQLSDDSFWKSENDLKAASNYLYTFLPTLPILHEIWSDDAFAKVPNNISEGSRLAPSTTADFNRPYQIIRAATNIIEKSVLAKGAGVAEGVINIYVGEARFFRAWSYFELVQKYGDVPLILHSLKEDSPELTAAPASREEVYDAIYQDLELAVNSLPTPTALGDPGYGRISKTAALALLSRVALFEGTRAKFHQYGEANKHLIKAVTASKAIIDSKEHSLFGDYFNLFQYPGEGRQNRENILVRQYGASVTESVLTHNSSRSYEQGVLNPTKSMVDAYLAVDGLPIEKSPLYVTPVNSEDVFKNRDKRLSWSIMKRGDPYYGTRPIFDIALLDRTVSGFCPRKFLNIPDWQTQRSYIDLPIIRYAEVLLNYAESKYELDGFIADIDLDISVNLLRSRGQIQHLKNDFVKTNNLDMRTEIRRERRVELAQEGFRYWDLIRWKTAEIELPKDVLGNYFFASEFGTAITPQLNSDNFILVQRASVRKFNAQRDYLWPIPINELGLNPNLKQNPGW